MVPLTVSDFTEKEKLPRLFLFFNSFHYLVSLNKTYLKVIYAYKVEKSSADKSPVYWQIMKFFSKLTQSLICIPLPSAYIFPIFVCHFFLLRF